LCVPGLCGAIKLQVLKIFINKNMRYLKSILVIILFLYSTFSEAQNLTSNSTGSFTFTPSGPLSSQPVEVFYHIPSGDIMTMPIVMSFHGANRNGDDYRDYWINMANANNFMVFAPEFSSTHYPGLGDTYLMANIFDDGDNPSPSTFNNPDEWTFSVLDPIFDSIVSDVNGNQQYYNAWGHSGGAQFLQRFVMYMPNSKLDVAVCSNAGWYTVPENSVSFPYGIQNGQLPLSDLNTAFSKKLIVHLGQNDTDPNAPGLRRNDVVDNQQGIHRLERGQYFFNTSQNEAQSQNATFNWEKHEVPNIGHDPQLMANDALPYVMMNTLSSVNFQVKKDILLYPNPAKDFIQLNYLPAKSKIEIFNINGQSFKRINNFDNHQPQSIDISELGAGIYFLSVAGQTLKFIKKQH
jgi:hypothetical protein